MNNYSINIENHKAKFNYEALEEFDAGIVLSGAEVKAIRKNNVDFTGSHVVIIDNEAFLLNFHIGVEGVLDTRAKRKLLLNKKEILNLKLQKESKGLTIIPLLVYNMGSRIKLKIALAKGRKAHDKRDYKQAQDVDRDVARELKEYN